MSDADKIKHSFNPFYIFDQIVQGITHRIASKDFKDIDFPCRKLDNTCPYGYLIELLHAVPAPIEDTDKCCPKFGHPCLMFFFAEKVEGSEQPNE